MLNNYTLMSRKTLFVALLSPLLPLLIVAQQAQEHVDLNAMHKIKDAEFGGGGRGGGGGGGGRAGRGAGGRQIMETMYYLSERYGPRLTNSPQFRAAGDWAVSQLKEWGLSNVHLESWETKTTGAGRGGAAGRGGPSSIPSWEMKGYTGAMVDPTF